jgi:hypothetical protein
LVAQNGGVRSFNAVLKEPSSDASYVRRPENNKVRKCCIVPQSVIKSEVWINLCTS